MSARLPWYNLVIHYTKASTHAWGKCYVYLLSGTLYLGTNLYAYLFRSLKYAWTLSGENCSQLMLQIVGNILQTSKLTAVLVFTAVQLNNSYALVIVLEH